MSWAEAWARPSFRWQWFATIVALVLLAWSTGRFFSWVQSRPGTVWNDPLLSTLTPVDLSVWIFSVLYMAIVGGLFVVSRNPLLLLSVMQSYVLLVLLRMGLMWCVPLEPDSGMILLIDPVVDRFFYSNEVITKDLFFSGHVSILALLGWATPVRGAKLLLAGATLLVAIFLLIQHVHYTADVVVAPFAAWIAWKAVNFVVPRPAAV